MPVTDWVADSDATNHTAPHPGHIFSPRPWSLAHPSSFVVGNGSVLPVTSVGNSVLPRPFYLNDVLVASDLVQSLLSVRCFTIDNSCSIVFDPFGLSVKDHGTRRVLAKYDSIGLLYTLPHPTLPTTTLRVVPYALATTASSATWLPYVMPASFVGTSGCPFLAPLLEPFSPLTSYTVTFGPLLF
jgi:hypothetical protein